jgi:hypothetical protein
MDKRWNEIKEIWRRNEWLWGLGGFIAGAIVVMAFQKEIISSELLGNLFSEGLGIAFTVVIIDRLYSKREEKHRIEELKARLIREARSRDNATATNAIREINELGWLKGEKSILAGKDFSDANWEEADLSHANLQNTILHHVKLARSELFYAKLTNADLLGASLEGANLFGADIDNIRISGANLQGANIRGAIANKIRLGLAASNIAYRKSNLFTILPDGSTVESNFLSGFTDIDFQGRFGVENKLDTDKSP